MKEIGYDLFSFVVQILHYGITAYVYIAALFYLLLLCAAGIKLYREKGIKPIQYDEVLHQIFAPSLSVLVPAYNEEVTIIPSVRSFLSMNYQNYEVIVINDGSKDQTLELLVEEFDMIAMKSTAHWSDFRKETMPIRKVYRSRTHPNLMLVDKDNGGKADALNVGIQMSKFPYFVTLDADTVLDPNAFIKIVKPIMDAVPGEEIVATGGSVGIANGSYVDNGYLQSDRVVLSKNPLVVMQVIEYLRAFLIGRIALSRMNLLLIVSGAFGVFRKDWVIEAGGYEVRTIGEDMELIVRLQRIIKEKKSHAKIVNIPEPVCWTEAPEEVKVLRRQRVRWHRGLFESLWRHKIMLFNPKYGAIGLLAMPYFFIVELLGPVIELLGYILLVYGLFGNEMNIRFSMLLMFMMMIYGSLLSMGSVLFEEWSFKRYNRASDVARLFLYALTESFWYRPIMTVWRLHGLISALMRKRRVWGDMPRKGSISGNPSI